MDDDNVKWINMTCNDPLYLNSLCFLFVHILRSTAKWNSVWLNRGIWTFIFDVPAFMNTLPWNLIFVSSQSVIIMLRAEGCLSDTINSYRIFVVMVIISNILVFTPKTLPPIRMIPHRFGKTVKYLPNSFSYSQKKNT